MIITRGFGTPDYPIENNVRDGIIYGLNAEFTGILDLPSESDVRYGVTYDNATKTGIAICVAVSIPSVGLDPTARLANVKDSLKKYFVDSLYTGEGIALTFDKALSTPTLQGTAVNRWVSVNFGLLDMETLSTLLLNIFCCTRGDAEGFRLAQLRDTVMNYLIDIEQSDRMRRIPFYRSRASGNWTLLAGGFIVQDVIESGELEAPDETKYRILTAKLRFASKI